ncbi:TatD family hydrolase [Pseudovibrio exalbescens]|uniref:TatD family hydrolase n=1 Tax=Pseudovibrio exalbescens TaxID=197461 RepID=UPI002366CAC5|nr:TatD family hydrolase [Pseudovibrio exalbescens]MDD7908818.1 TatD family hydrolase [Pseudovibrio exalbescens]
MLIDSHCHLDFPDFAEERDEIITRAHEADVKLMVTICTRVRRFEQIREIANNYASVFCSVGTHPHNAAEEIDVSADEILKLSAEPKVIAIGEAGLDYYYDNSPRDEQQTVFRRHIAVARETGLPLAIHTRDADEDMARILEEEMGKGAFKFLLHCFSSGRELAMRAKDLGAYYSLSGILTFKRSEELREIVADLPMDRLLVETDAPYLAPQPWRGKRNEPAYVAHTNKILAQVHGVSEETMATQTTDNFFKLFSKVPQELHIRSEG